MRQVYVDSHFLFRRTAFVEDGVLQALALESLEKEPLEGAVFLGRITAIVPALEAVFVDVGLDQEAFLPIHDLPVQDRSHNLKNGKEILVQLKSDSGRFKGPKVTAKIELPGRYLVLLPGSTQKSVSKRLKDASRRKSLIEGLDTVLGELGYIVRTEGTLADCDHVIAEAKRLKIQWDELCRAYVTVKAPKCLYTGLSQAQRLMLTHLSVPETEIVLADPSDWPGIEAFIAQYDLPANVFKTGSGKRPDPFLFEREHGLERQIQALTERKVDFGGSYLLLDPTEAFMAVDVNAGAASAEKRQAFNMKRSVNQAGIMECLRQLELRNYGGMVMMDLIDAEGDEERRFYTSFLQKTLKKGYSGIFASDVSPLGILSMTRRRSGRSLSDTLTVPCRCCGQGRMPSPAWQLDKMLKEAIRRQQGMSHFKVSDEVYQIVQGAQPMLERLEMTFNLKLRFERDPSLNHLSIQIKKDL